MNNKTILVILDGWGIGDGSKSDAIANANTPVMHTLLKVHEHATLKTSGEDVGLPDGQMGNSEVGHLNIGAGRIVYQELARINKAIRERTILSNENWQAMIESALLNNSRLHLVGLLSDGGVHSHINHLLAFIAFARQSGVKELFIHAFTDGRDTDPKSGLGFLTQLQQVCDTHEATLQTICGRYYAMDRDKRWERVKKAYQAMVEYQGTKDIPWVEFVNQAYNDGITDEFLPAWVNKPEGVIKANDTVLFFNYRTDRGRQLTTALTQEAFPDYGMRPLALNFYTLTLYDINFKHITPIFSKDDLHQTLGEVLAFHKKTQVRAAETEKYPHVTFFFSGGQEAPFEGETRILAPSPKVATYDLQPEMSAWLLTDLVLNALDEKPDFICLNYANPDMVGHTGVYEAIVKAVETIDTCLGKIIDKASNLGYTLYVTADHGNADYAINADGSPNTAHTTNPVPFIRVGKFKMALKPGILADIAPTILQEMGVPQPDLMTGHSLLL